LLLITKHGSALLLVLSSALALPITNVIFTFPALMGGDTEEGSIWNTVGLLFVVFGFLIYALAPSDDSVTVHEVMPMQGPSGQMTFVVDELPDAPLQAVSAAIKTIMRPRTRRRSFDMNASPSYQALQQQRRQAALSSYLRNKGSPTKAAVPSGRANMSSRAAAALAARDGSAESTPNGRHAGDSVVVNMQPPRRQAQPINIVENGGAKPLAAAGAGESDGRSPDDDDTRPLLSSKLLSRTP
jgi:hypothetical protein